MKPDNVLYISQECEWEEVDKGKKKYIRVLDLRQGREILLTSHTYKVWMLIDKGYKVMEIIQAMEKDHISPSEVVDILNQLSKLKLVISIDEP